MNWLQTILLLLAAFLGVFAEAVVDFPRTWLGSQLNVLPALIVYAALNSSIASLALVAMLGGLWGDALSGNPLGVSVLPLFWVGLTLQRWRDLLLRQLPFAQSILGLIATATVTLATLVVLLTLGERPLLGWGSLWQLLVVSLGGAGLAPLCFAVLEGLQRTFAYEPAATAAFRPDREIKRGRH